MFKELSNLPLNNWYPATANWHGFNHFSRITGNHGLGGGVGRPLGVGWDLGVGVGRGVGVDVDVAVAVGVGLGGIVAVAVGVGVGVAVAVGVGVNVAVAVGVGVKVAVAVAVAVDVGVAVAVAVGLGLAVGVGLGVPTPAGPWIATIIGDPVLKKPTVALALCGGWSASKRKLYNVPQRIALAFWFWADVSVFQVMESGAWVTLHGVLL
jgi:hypothetical protein